MVFVLASVPTVSAVEGRIAQVTKAENAAVELGTVDVPNAESVKTVQLMIHITM